MSDAAVRRVAAAIVAVVFVLEVAAVCLTVDEGSLVQPILYLVYAVTQAGAGGLILHRFPRHVIGWLLLLYAFEGAVMADFVPAYGIRAAHERWPGSSFAQLLGLTSWIFAASGLILLFLMFPDGRLPSARWRWVIWSWAAGAVLALPGWVFDPRLGSQFVDGVNPYAIDGFPAGPVFGVGAGLVSGALVLSVVALVLRLRWASGPERDQLKWVVFAAAVVGLVLPLSAALWTVWRPIQLLAAIALVLLPVSACVAVLRHRLYDVDTVITRTVAYAVIAALVASVYFAVVLVAAGFVASPAAAAAGALVVAVTFRPVHDRVQAWSARWLRPARHRAVSSIAAFVEALRHEDALVSELDSAFRKALCDEAFTLVVQLPDGVLLDSEGGLAEEPGMASGRGVLRVPTGAGTVALLDFREGDERLVSAVVDAGRLAVEIAALEVQLRRQVREVEASRSRIQSIADEERRRIARDLHDGAQQRLVAIGLALRHAQLDMPHTSVSAAIDDAVVELRTSIDELRELAGGLRPSSLDQGLASALRELAERTPVRLDVTVPAERFPSHIETAAYFVVCEAVTNAVKHAAASHISVTLVNDRRVLVMTVVDDGCGGAEPRRGTGLLGLADRVRAHRGQLEVDSPVGGGTRLKARLPCG